MDDRLPEWIEAFRKMYGRSPTTFEILLLHEAVSSALLDRDQTFTVEDS